MQFGYTMNSPSPLPRASQTGSRRRLHGAWIVAGLFAVVVLSSVALRAQSTAPNPDKSIHDPALTTPPDANAQMEMREQQTQKQDFAAANEERKKQISEDTAKLLKLAADLKAEVDKTNKDTLSLNVIRKADEIERLAHNVKEKMKLTVGGS